MTDQITDQDRRDARQWAEAIGRSDAPCAADLWHAASRYILATVDAPDTTLAEELARIAENSPVWTIQNVCDELKSAAARAEQMERERNTLEQQRDYWCDSERQAVKDRDHLAAEIDKANTDILHLTAERDEARAEVERLTAVNENLRRNDNYREFKEFLGVQKGAESNAESIDPADVKPGEAWLVESGGQTVTACRLNPTSSRPWIVQRHTFGGLPFHWVADSDITLVSRLVPAPRVITDPDELDALAEGTIVRDKDGDAWRRTCDEWTTTADYGRFTSWAVSRSGPVTVLWEPEA